MPAYLSPDLQNIIDGMLALDPSERLKIPDIRKHPWLSLCSKACTKRPIFKG
jgi:serine/threonine protein kinase